MVPLASTLPSPLLQGGCDYEVASVYLWSVGGSWNVIGLGLDEGTRGWRDEQALDIISAHNEAARAAAAEERQLAAAAAATDGPAAAGTDGHRSQAAEPAGR